MLAAWTAVLGIPAASQGVAGLSLGDDDLSRPIAQLKTGGVVVNRPAPEGAAGQDDDTTQQQNQQLEQAKMELAKQQQQDQQDQQTWPGGDMVGGGGRSALIWRASAGLRSPQAVAREPP